MWPEDLSSGEQRTDDFGLFGLILMSRLHKDGNGYDDAVGR